MITEDRTLPIAYHEAGHIVAAWWYGIPTHAAFMRPELNEGQSQLWETTNTPWRVRLVIMLAGLAAQRLGAPGTAETAAEDRYRADMLLSEHTAELEDADFDRLSRRWERVCASLFLKDAVWRATQAVALRMIAERNLNEGDVTLAIAPHLPFKRRRWTRSG